MKIKKKKLKLNKQWKYFAILSSVFVLFFSITATLLVWQIIKSKQLASIKQVGGRNSCEDLAFADNFNDNNLDAGRWSSFVATGSGSTVSEENGLIRVNIPNGRSEYTNGGIKILEDLSGNFEITTNVIIEQISSPQASFASGLFFHDSDLRNALELKIISTNTEGKYDLIAVNRFNHQNETIAGISLTGTDLVRIKIKRRDDKVEWYYKIGDGDFISLGQVTNEFYTGAGLVILSTKNYGPDFPGITSTFDNFSLSCPTLNPLACLGRCETYDDCNIGLTCTKTGDVNRCLNYDCPEENDCECPEPTPTPLTCLGRCDTDDDCDAGLICKEAGDSDTKRCLKYECPEENDCECPEPTPVPLTCLGRCDTDADCDSGLICKEAGDSDTKRCLKYECPEENDCLCFGVSPSFSPSPSSDYNFPTSPPNPSLSPLPSASVSASPSSTLPLLNPSPDTDDLGEDSCVVTFSIKGIGCIGRLIRRFLSLFVGRILNIFN